jgi:sn-glycerol 3-phosphate transport system permease protein
VTVRSLRLIRPRLGNLDTSQLPLGFALLAPSLLIFAVFTFYPLVKTAILGLYVSDPFGRGQVYVGPSQYIDVLTSPAVLHSLSVTVGFAVYTVAGTILISLGLALLANAKLRSIGVFRTLFSSTLAVSVAVAALAWLQLFNPSVGVLNYLLRLIGLSPVAWLTSPQWALISVSMATIWMQLGFGTMVLLAGLQGIPQELYESVRVDGARSMRAFFTITLPMLSPSLFFLLVISTIRSFESFGQIDILTSGGPLQATNVLVYSIYREAFFNFHVGTASVEALLLFAIVLGVTAVHFFVLERRVVYG